MLRHHVIPLLTLCLSTGVTALELDDYEFVDLSHEYGDHTLYWPTSPTAFQKETLAFGDSGAGYFYSAYSVCTPEHGGTHLDAPIHFAEGGMSTADIPLRNLIAPAVVIDVSGKAAGDRNYRLTAADVGTFETVNGVIEKGTIVLVATGWSRYWPDALAYLGDDTPGDATNLQFPGIAADAMRLLAEERGVANLENLTGLDELPATGAYVMALPMKIAGGSGGPARVVALVPRD
jgi:kynurenine formamidase